LTNETLRLRIFAGPNGSGKSSIINSIRTYTKENGTPLDFGIYLNADDIAKELREGGCDLSVYCISFNKTEFEEIIASSGLLIGDLTSTLLPQLYEFKREKIILLDLQYCERFAQLVATYLRTVLLREKKKFSFETVFSHAGKLDFMKEAKALGYKVYLYFVSTEDPEINVYRVKEVRVKQHGHDVPEDKIRSRYLRTMDLMYEASQLAYRSYYFDNSAEGKDFNLFASFKIGKDGSKQWDIRSLSKVPIWFRNYYSGKVRS
jgi:predicted ABC-type ATPase